MLSVITTPMVSRNQSTRIVSKRKGHTAGKKATAQLKLYTLLVEMLLISQRPSQASIYLLPRLRRPTPDSWHQTDASALLVVQVRPGHYNCKMNMDYQEGREHLYGERFFKEN